MAESVFSLGGGGAEGERDWEGAASDAESEWGGARGRRRAASGKTSYAEPSLRRKMRQV